MSRSTIVGFVVMWLAWVFAPHTFAQAPVIATAPLSKLVVVGQPVTFTVSGTGAAPLTYQWSHHGQAIAGATAATLTIPSVSDLHRGWYQVAVTNSTGSVKSAFALDIVGEKIAVLGWGANFYDNQSIIPPGLGAVGSIATGRQIVALKTDGSVGTWSADGGSLVPILGTGAVAVSTRSDVLVLKADGTVVSWGNNLYGQSNVPSNLSGVVGVAAGGGHSLALKSDGTITGWGLNDDARATAPLGLSNVVSVAAGSAHSLALKGDGTVVAWGSNFFGQLSIPAGLSNVVAIAAGSAHSLALRVDGTVVGWGGNADGQATVPIGLSGVVRISAGDSHSVAVKADGTIVGWGSNRYGQLKTPTGVPGVLGIAAGADQTFALIPAIAPVIVQSPSSGAVAPGGSTLLSVTVSGTRPLAYLWKKNGTVVTGATSSALSFTAALVAAAGSYTVDVSNAAGTVTSQPAVLTVAVPPVFTARPFSRLVSVGQPVTFSAAATGTGALTYEWRRNGRAVAAATGASLSLAAASMNDRGFYEVLVRDAGGGLARSVFHLNVTPIPVTRAAVRAWTQWSTALAVPPEPLSDVVAVAAGERKTLAVRSDGTAVEWNADGYPSYHVEQAAGLAVAAAAGASQGVFLRADGKVTTGGVYSYGFLSDVSDAVAVAAGSGYTVALRSDGTLVASGNIQAPLEEAALSDVVAISLGLALRRDGTVRKFAAYLPDPPSNLTGVTAVAGGESHFLALKQDGTVVGWGSGSAATVPAGLGNVVAISAGAKHSLAVKADGTLVGWGDSSQVQILPNPAITEVIAVSAGTHHNVALVPAQAPTVVTPPVSQSISAGQNAVFSVVAAGTSPMFYQWKKNGTALPGATNTSVAINNAIETDSGSYTVVLQNSGGSVESTAATLVVQEPLIAPVVRRAPQSISVMGGVDATLSLTAGGASPRSIQWYAGYPGDVTQPIAGATGSSITLNSSSASQRVWARVTNSLGSVDTLSAVVLRWETVDTKIGNTWDLVASSYTNGRFFASSESYTGTSVDGSTWTSSRAGGAIGNRTAYGNGIYVMGPTYFQNGVYTSTDGVTWTPRTEAGLSGVRQVVHNGKVFIALDSQRTLNTSTDGIAWVQRYSAPSYLFDLCHGNGLSVAVGRAGNVVTSTDGLVWTSRTAPTSADLRSVLFANGRFLATSDAGEILTSPDGISWTLRGAVYPALYYTSGGGGVFLGVGAAGSLSLSADAVTWTRAANFFPAYGTVSFAYGGGRFILTVDDGKILRSLPLAAAITTANQPAVPAVLSGNAATLSVATTGTGLQFQWYLGSAGDISQPIAGATTSSYTTPSLTQATQYWVRVSNPLESVASATFNVVIALPPTITQPPQSVDILAESAATVAVVTAGPPPPSVQWYAGQSGDVSQPVAGATSASHALPPQALSANYWARATTIAGTADSASAAVTRWDLLNGQVVANQLVYFKGKYFAATGKLLSSIDGRTWSEAYHTPYTENIQAVAHNGTMLVAIGDNRVLTSIDGATFTPTATPTNTGNNGTLAFGNGVFVTSFGFGYPGASADGVTWTAGTGVVAEGLGGSSIFSRICFGNGKFVAVGANNSPTSAWVIASSPDGRTWTQQAFADNSPTTLTSVAFGGGQFVAVGYDRTVLTSPDGVAWMRRSAVSTNAILKGVSYGNGVWLIGAGKDEYLRSTDGVTWTSQKGPAHFSGDAVEFLNGQFLAAGALGWVYSSVNGADWTLLSAWPFVGVEANSGSAPAPKGLAIGNGKIVLIGGETLASGASSLFVSTDTVRWTAGNLPGLVTTPLVFAQGAFVCGGTEGRIYRSEDAVTWETLFPGSGNDSLLALVHNGRQFAALSSGRQIFLSDDGRNWSTTGALTPETGVLASSGSVHVLGRDRQIYISTDWRNWAAATVPSSAYRIEDIAYGNGVFVAFNWPSASFFSADGVTWTPTTGLEGWSFYSVKFAGGRFLTLSSSGHAWSLDGRTWRANAFDTARLEERGVSGRMPQALAASGGDLTVIAGTPYLLVARRAPTSVGIVEQPVGQIVQAGQTTTLRVITAGTGLTYQWFEGLSGDVSRPVADATSAVLITPALTAKTDYWVRVTFAGGVQLSTTAHVEVLIPPAITSQPADVITSPGANVSFSVAATSAGPLNYQWTFNGAPLAGATSATYAIANVQATHVGAYAVAVFNATGATTSRTAVLRGPNPVPVIQTQPQTGPLVAGQNATLTVAATGVGALTYQWRRNGAVLPGATSPSLSLSPATRAAAGLYDVTISDGLSSTRSQTVRVEIAPMSYPQVVRPDPAFAANLTASGGMVSGFQRLTDGRVLIFGSFTTVNGTAARHLARLNANGSVDAAFSRALPNDTVAAVAVQPDGKVVIAGAFTQVDGQPRAGLARLNADGSLDSTFVPDANFMGAFAVVVLPDGRVVVGGGFAGLLARTSSAGLREAAFAPAPNGPVYALAVQSDGAVVAGGAFTMIAGESRGRLVRFAANGAFDAAFAAGSAFNGDVYALKLGSGDRIVAGGAFTLFNGVAASRIARLTAAGAADATWSSVSGFNGAVYTLDVRSDDGILAGGAFTSYRGSTRRYLVRLTSTGALDTTLASLLNAQPLTAVSFLTSGEVLIGGAFSSLGSALTPRGNLALLSAAGALVTTFGPGLSSPAALTKAVPLADGKTIVVGNFASADGATRPYLARLGADGRNDPTFNPGGSGPNGPVRDVLIQPDGKMLIVGAFSTYNDVAGSPGLTRLLANGARDDSFNSAWFTEVYWAAPASGGKIYIFNPNVSGYLRRINADGSLDASFDAASSSALKAAVELPDGKIIVVGAFTGPTGTRQRILRLLSGGGIDPLFNAGADGTINAVAVQPDGRLVIAGEFLTVNGVPRARIARLTATGALDESFAAGFGPNAAVSSLSLQEDGRIFVLGSFTAVNGFANTAYVARLMPNGAVDSTFAVPGLSEPVAVATVLDNGSLLLAGTKLVAHGTSPATGVARFLSAAGPVIDTQPASVALVAGLPLSLTVNVIGGDGVTYQWLKDDVVLAGATAAVYSVASAQAAHAGSYRVRISHTGGAFDSATASVSVAPSAPAWAAGNAIAGFGGAIQSGSRWPLVAPALAVGSDPLTYQWTKNGHAIAGATTRNLLPTLWLPSDTGTYQVSITNSVGTLTSAPFSQAVTMTPDWDWQMPKPQGNPLADVTFINSRFLAGGQRGTLLTSVDGQAWTLVRLGVTNTVFDFAFGNGVYVALSGFSGVWSSRDAGTWTQRTSAAGQDGNHLSSLTFGAGRFVAVGAGGTVVTSVDGETWSRVITGQADTLFSVVFGGGKFVALGGGGRTYISADGLTWTARATLPRTPGRLAYGAGQFVAAGENRLFVSADGLVWAEKMLGTSARIVSLKYTAAGFLAVLDSTDGRYWKSADGLGWAEQTTNMNLSSAASALTFGAGRYVTAGSAQDSLMTSTNGTAWNRPTTTTSRSFTAAATDGTTLVAVASATHARIASDGSISRLDVVSTMLTDARDVAFGGGVFVAVAGGGQIATSPDGAAWTSRISGTTSALHGVSFLGDRFYAVGAGGILLTSLDGIVWSPGSTGWLQSLSKVAFGAGAYVAVGAGGAVLRSVDGTTWNSQLLSGITSNLADVVFASGKFVAISEGGSIRTSPDGVTWTAQANPLGLGLKAITFAGGKFFAFALNGAEYLISPDAVTWVPAQHGGAMAIADAVPLGDRLYLFGANTAILSAPLHAPTLTAQPIAQNKPWGGSAVFSVTASGTGPTVYQWFRNGTAIPGATAATLELSTLTTLDAGTYAVAVANAAGVITSAATALNVAPPAAPAIVVQPKSQAVAVGESVVLRVTATGVPAPSYQWHKDGAPLSGMTLSTYPVATAAGVDAGSYTVTLSNVGGQVTSAPAVLSVLPAGTVATHAVVGGGYTAGATATISNVFVHGGAPQRLAWQVLLPPGWTLVSVVGAGADVSPTAGSADLLEWVWHTLPAGSLSFSYSVNVPAAQRGFAEVVALAELTPGGSTARILAKPDPLLVGPSHHSADTNRDRRLSLTELTRVIELFNTRHGTARTGAYSVSASATEDGFLADATRVPDANASLATYHAADVNSDGRLGLLELTRVIELYNARAGTTRTGAYHVLAGTEDGFAPGP